MRMVHLDSWGAVVAALDSPTPEYYTRLGRTRSSESEGRAHDWDWRAGWSGARKMAGAAGWPDGVARIKRFTDRFVSSLASKIALPEYYPEVTGEYFDVGVLMSGEPEHWYQREDSTQTIDAAGRVYRVVLNLGASALVDADDIARRGAAAAAVVQLLELSGRTVELIAVGTTCKGARLGVAVMLKAANDSLDLDRLALIAIHPAGLRRLWFRLYENLATDAERDANYIYSGGSYGAPEDVPEADRGDIYSPTMYGSSGSFGSDYHAERWIEEQLCKLGAIE